MWRHRKVKIIESPQGMAHVVLLVLGSRIVVGYLVIKIELWFFSFLILKIITYNILFEINIFGKRGERTSSSNILWVIVRHTAEWVEGILVSSCVCLDYELRDHFDTHIGPTKPRCWIFTFLPQGYQLIWPLQTPIPADAPKCPFWIFERIIL